MISLWSIGAMVPGASGRYPKLPNVSACGTNQGKCVTEDFWLIVANERSEDEPKIDDNESTRRKGRAGHSTPNTAEVLVRGKGPSRAGEPSGQRSNTPTPSALSWSNHAPVTSFTARLPRRPNRSSVAVFALGSPNKAWGMSPANAGQWVSGILSLIIDFLHDCYNSGRQLGAF